MSQALQGLSENIESIPGFGVVSGVYEDVAPDYLKTKDPFYEKIDGEEKRRKPPPGISEHERKIWKSVMKRAWYHDRNFCNCFPIDLGLGIIPIVSIFPVIGPIIAYTMHGKLVKMCADGGAPAKLQAAMLANMATDFAISLCPVLGVLFSWMYGCSTRNAALFDTHMRKAGTRRENVTQAGDITQQAQQRDLDRRLAAAHAQPPRSAQSGQAQSGQARSKQPRSEQTRSPPTASHSQEGMTRGIVHSAPSQPAAQPAAQSRGIAHSQPRGASQQPASQPRGMAHSHPRNGARQPLPVVQNQPASGQGHRRTPSQRKPVPATESAPQSEEEQIRQAMALSLQDQRRQQHRPDKEYQQAVRASLDDQVNSGPNREVELAVQNSMRQQQQPIEPDMRAAISASLRDSGPSSPSSPSSPTHSRQQSLNNPYRAARKPVAAPSQPSQRPSQQPSQQPDRFQFALPAQPLAPQAPAHAHAPTHAPAHAPAHAPTNAHQAGHGRNQSASAIYGPASMSFPEPEPEVEPGSIELETYSSYPAPNSLVMPEPREH